MKSVLSPSMGGVGLAEYVCTHPCLIFTEEDPGLLSRGSVLHLTLPVDRVTRRKFRMAPDSDDLFIVNIVI